MVNNTGKETEKPIILLDLNYTLVGNSAAIKSIRPYQEKIKPERQINCLHHEN